MQPSSVLSNGPRARGQRFWSGLYVACSLVCCAQGTVSNGTLAALPTVDNLPTETAAAQLDVAGTRPPNTTISARFADGAVQTLAVAGDAAAKTWTGRVHLAEGNNTFVLVAEDSAGNVHTSAPYFVVLNPRPPSAPGVQNAYAGQLFVYTAEGSAPVLHGQKDANTSISINGAVAVALDAETTWQYSLPPLDATTPLPLSLVATNRAGQSSAATAVAVRSTTTPPLALDAVVSPSNAPQVQLTGSHAAGAVMHAIWQGQPVDTQLTAPDASHFALLAQLRTSGVTDGVLEAIFYQTLGGVQGPYARVDIAYDIVPPLPAVVASPTDFGQSAPIIIAGTGTPANLQLAGRLPEAGSVLCVGLGGMTPCQLTQGPADTFALSVPLQKGDNLIVVSSVDAAGNTSTPVAAHAYVTTPPAFVIDSPAAGNLVSGDSVQVSGQVYLTPADKALPAVVQAMALADIEVCIDGLNCQSADMLGDYFVATVALTGLASGTHTIAVHGTTRSGDSYSAAAGSPGQADVVYFSPAPTWLNGAQATVLGARAPQLALDRAGTAHIVWEDFCPNLGTGCPVAQTGPVGPDIFYTTRSASGVWAKSVQSVSSLGASDGQSRTPTIALDEAGLVHIAWSDNGAIVGSPNGNYGILHRTLDPATGALSTIDVVAGQDGLHAKQPQLAGNTYGQSAQVHLSWQRDTNAGQTPPLRDIYYARQLASPPLVGNTVFGAWSAPLKVTADANTGTAASPDVAMGPDGHVCVVWQECRGASCTQGQAAHAVRMMDIVDPNTLDPSGSVVVTNSLTDRDGIQPTVSVTPDNTRHVIWQGLSETGGADPNVPAIFGRQYRGRTPDVRQPAAMWLSATTKNAARAPWVTGSADGRFAIAWSQAIPSNSRTSRVAVRLGTMSLGPGATTLIMPDTGSVALHPSIALDPVLPQAVHVVWDNMLTLGAGKSTTTQTGCFYAIAATP